MTSVNPTHTIRSAPSTQSLHFGFIPQTVIARFQSTDYEQRVDASTELLELVRNSEIADIDIHSLLLFIEPNSCDQNYLIAQNVSQILSAIINQLALNNLTCAPHLHQIIHIILLMFEDRRRTVCQLGQDTLIDLLATNDHYAVISELVRSSSTPSSKVSVEIFRCFTNLLSKNILDPNTLLQFPFYFDVMILSPLKNVRQAVLWCVDYLKNNSLSSYNTLASLMSREAAALLGKGPGNPTTAVTKSRPDQIVVNRVLNTAGKVEAAKAKAAMNFTRTMPLSRNQYQRPSLPSGKGARQINILASMSRPVTSKSNPATFMDDDQPPNFVSIEEESGNSHMKLDKLNGTGMSSTTQNFPPNSLFDDEITLPPLTESPIPENVFPPSKHILNKRFITEPIPDNPPIHHPPPLPKKKPSQQNTSRKRLITFDASVFPPQKNDEFDSSSAPSAKSKPRAKSEMKHISFAQTAPPHITLPPISSTAQQTPIQNNISDNNLSDQDDQVNSSASGNESDRPIKSSGFYNLGDDIDFTDIITESKISTVAKKKKPQFSMPIKRNPPKKHAQSSLGSSPSSSNAKNQQSRLEVKPQHQKAPSIPKIIENLKSEEWNDQNDAITTLINSIDQNIQPICDNLREIVASLLECSASLRSMLASNALKCLMKLIKTKKIDFEPIADMCGSSLLQLLSTHKSKHFIFDLSGDDFIALIESISVQKAIDILKNEHKRKHDDARVKVAFCMIGIVQRTTDFTQIIKPLADLVQDRNPDVRKHAKTAVSDLRIRSTDFDQLINSNVLTDDDRVTIQGVL